MDNMQWEQRTSTQIKLSKLEVGAEIMGKFLWAKDVPIKDRETGELKEVMSYTIETLTDTKEKIQFLGDAGFNTEFTNANIKEGDALKVVKGPQVDLGKGKRVNTYQIFVGKKH